MSKFDDPFADPTIDNPFADPSVQQVAQNTNSAQRGLDDYNPFDGSNPNNASGTGAQQQPAIMQEISSPAPFPSRNQAQPQGPPSGFTTADLQRRQEELERKAQELERREAALSGSSSRRNNWPPIPSFCPFEPCFYQDINVDIPIAFQKLVQQLYYLWMFHTLSLCANVIGGFILLITMGEVTTFGLSILFFVLFTPFSFLCWYRPIYKAFTSDSSFNFMVFFFVFFFQFFIAVIQAVGFNGSGWCGLITSLTAFKSSIFAGIVTILITISFGVAAAADLLLIAKVHRIYRSTGASFAKAQQEFTTEIFRNQHVQTAASNAAAAAINSQINAQTNNRF